ncbi:cytidylyltransferase family-domain-containing protein [Abortiporus biennis]|nr:cytidylyltransferase family-domain-containing protein [Abortiporus biennis]
MSVTLDSTSNSPSGKPVVVSSSPKAENGHVVIPTEKELTVQEAESQKKRQNALTRTLWTFIMIGGFITLLLMGHGYMILLVMLCQTLVYREVTALFSIRRKGTESDSLESRGRDPWSKTLNWYFFAVANYFLYGESIIYYFKHVVFSTAQLAPFATNHRMISFTLYTIGFMGFVMSLRRGYLKQQFGLFCWVHMTLLFIVVSSHFIVNNILEGLIWFWVPASLVICNDIFAYIWGITVGRTPLIKLSPKKTVEGFVGALFSTIVFGIFWGTYFMRFDYMICPVRDLGVSAFDTSFHCTPNPVFVWRDFSIPAPVSVFLSTLLGRSITVIPYAPYQIHVLFMACFASLVAPFGGFFASGFKRAFNIKDFGHSIPGHGGMTDRMDCQFLMGVFTYVYYSSLIRQHNVTVGSVLQTIVSGLTIAEQLELMKDLKGYLESQGIAVNI